MNRQEPLQQLGGEDDLQTHSGSRHGCRPAWVDRSAPKGAPGPFAIQPAEVTREQSRTRFARAGWQLASTLEIGPHDGRAFTIRWRASEAEESIVRDPIGRVTSNRRTATADGMRQAGHGN